MPADLCVKELRYDPRYPADIKTRAVFHRSHIQSFLHSVYIHNNSNSVNRFLWLEKRKPRLVWGPETGYWMLDGNETESRKKKSEIGGLPALRWRIDGRAGREGASPICVAAAAGVVGGGVRRGGGAVQSLEGRGI